MSDWRPAESLVILRSEADAVAPARSRTYDGTLGDDVHAARASRHNPNAAGVVCARDITHDPAHGMDTYDLFEWLRLHPHPDLDYVISNRRAARRANGFTVHPYRGSNAHDHHIHVAVGRGTDAKPTPPYDDTDSWGLTQWKQAKEEDMDQATFDHMFDKRFDERIVTTVAVPEIDEARGVLARMGILSLKHKGMSVPSLSLIAVMLHRALKKAGVT